MARKLFLSYLAISLGPLALAMAAWALRDALKRTFQPTEESGVGADGSEEDLAQTVEEVRAAGSEG
ncbi:MAG: hypothetical protein ACE5KW_05720 [Dehalococcoidia bacterium]